MGSIAVLKKALKSALTFPRLPLHFRENRPFGKSDNRKGSSQYPTLPAWLVYRKKALFKRGVRCSEALGHFLAEGRILAEFSN
jgi:hypothetical protein